MYYPYWNDNSSTNTFPYVTVETPFTETIYLKNGMDNLPDETHPADPEYTLKGESQLKVGTQTEQIAYPADLVTNVYNIRPVYGLRFKGTNQYAAYRWETCKIASDPLERYLSIRIKALHPQDNATTIDDVADETFWQDGFIEFQFPASGYYSPENAGNPTPENITHRGVYGIAGLRRCGRETRTRALASWASTSMMHTWAQRSRQQVPAPPRKGIGVVP